MERLESKSRNLILTHLLMPGIFVCVCASVCVCCVCVCLCVVVWVGGLASQ